MVELGSPRLVKLKMLKLSQRTWRVVDSRLSGVLNLNSFQSAKSKLFKGGPTSLPFAALPKRHHWGVPGGPGNTGASKAWALNHTLRSCVTPDPEYKATPGIRSGLWPISELIVLVSPIVGENQRPDSMMVEPLNCHPPS